MKRRISDFLRTQGVWNRDIQVAHLGREDFRHLGKLSAVLKRHGGGSDHIFLCIPQLGLE